jgi:serine/threonine protein kinase
MFENEIAAFKKLSQSATLKGSIIGFYGTYIHGETCNIILEYADKGDLESFFQHELPPSTAPDIVEFWKKMFSIADALKFIQNLDPGDSDTRAQDGFG